MGGGGIVGGRKGGDGEDAQGHGARSCQQHESRGGPHSFAKKSILPKTRHIFSASHFLSASFLFTLCNSLPLSTTPFPPFRRLGAAQKLRPSRPRSYEPQRKKTREAVGLISGKGSIVVVVVGISRYVYRYVDIYLIYRLLATHVSTYTHPPINIFRLS